MSSKIIEVVGPAGHLDTVLGIAEGLAIDVLWHGVDENRDRMAVHMLVSTEYRQRLMDDLYRVLGASETARILVLPVEAVLPDPFQEPKEADKEAAGKKARAVSREELYTNVAGGADLTGQFLLLTVLSTIVAAIGLLENNVAVVIGAMVIAPLLGPNLALALGTSMADTRLIGRSLRTNAVGLGGAILIGMLLATVMSVDVGARELQMRTEVGLDSVALALASGAAAVLSLTTGLPTVLVGVMVAVALLPPAATVGIMLGSGEFSAAYMAALLLAVNVVCVNLAAKLVFLYQGVRPRGQAQQAAAAQSMAGYLLLWAITLALLVFLILEADVTL
ncbi:MULTISPECIES: TIGR00341 family protein [unclassified Thioalkalivibrio]|uniref:TIGR00341 family protein n=1 Tax=unclassified Thioalkalivibrio TaxID=2621013 RepID=UPI000360097C|nr:MULTISPECIES: TIGR00341 family protein [unclassified Thioalkalivibrio]